jgi:choline dehydrogenase-like flavoprotein
MITMSDVGYDYVIVGAGSAGCVLANRLTEDAEATVLLLEAGGSDRHPYIQIPLGLGKLWQQRMFDWGYNTEPKPHLDDRRLPLRRGKVIGGSSSVNVMVYSRGHRGDFDRWAREGAAGVGLGRAQFTIRAGRRASAANAYLKPILRRSNLALRTGVLATRIAMRNGRAVGVHFFDRSEERYVEAAREVILCGGTFNSPHLLMLSGIGPANHLRELGIPPTR